MQTAESPATSPAYGAPTTCASCAPTASARSAAPLSHARCMVDCWRMRTRTGLLIWPACGCLRDGCDRLADHGLLGLLRLSGPAWRTHSVSDADDQKPLRSKGAGDMLWGISRHYPVEPATALDHRFGWFPLAQGSCEHRGARLCRPLDLARPAGVPEPGLAAADGFPQAPAAGTERGPTKLEQRNGTPAASRSRCRHVTKSVPGNV
jgi:hypothetical protein